MSARVTAIGGGTGLAVLLRGLKRRVSADALRAVVTVTDDGGSSGRLRREFGVLPPGDIRNCIAALADDEDLLTRLFQYRFVGGEGLSGHSFGNLFLTALTGITGDFYQAILTAERVLSVRGQILPATLTDVRLSAEGRSGRQYDGESAVGTAGEGLERVVLEPASPMAFPAAVEALEKADVIVLGPGSLYTSILPNLLIPRIREVVLASRAHKVLVLNLMTQPGETDGMSGLDHLLALERHVGAPVVDTILFHDSELPRRRVGEYAAARAVPRQVEADAVQARGVHLLVRDLLDSGDLLRHNPEALASSILELASSESRPLQGSSPALVASSVRRSGWEPS